MPKSMHSAIKWSDKNPFPVNPVTEDSPWTIVKTSGKNADTSKEKGTVKHDISNFISAKGTQALRSIGNSLVRKTEKRKRDMEEEELRNTTAVRI